MERAQGHRFVAGLLQPSKGKGSKRYQVLSCELGDPTVIDLCLLSIVTREGTQMDVKVTCVEQLSWPPDSQLPKPIYSHTLSYWTAKGQGHHSLRSSSFRTM